MPIPGQLPCFVVFRNLGIRLLPILCEDVESLDWDRHVGKKSFVLRSFQDAWMGIYMIHLTCRFVR